MPPLGYRKKITARRYATIRLYPSQEQRLEAYLTRTGNQQATTIRAAIDFFLDHQERIEPCTSHQTQQQSQS